MNKGKAARVAGFIGALCATGALVATAVEGTGAYFTDAASGSIAANSGSLTLSANNTALDFKNLMPGTDQTQNVNYRVKASSGKIDLWLVFDNTSDGYGHFTGTKDTPYGTDHYTGGGMGRFGHFAVGSTPTSGAQNLAFSSYNLQYDPNQACTNATTGRGTEADSPGSLECGAPAAIQLATNLASGATGTVDVTYGLTGKQTQQNQTEWTVGYQIVATQAGQSPVNN